MTTDERSKSRDEQAQSIPSRERLQVCEQSEGDLSCGSTDRREVIRERPKVKRAFILFWHGLTALLAGIANWFTVILGMRDDSKYGKFIRRVVGTCFCLIMVMIASAVVYAVGRAFYEELPRDMRYGDDYYDTQYISRSVTYYTCSGEDGYVKTSDGKKTISGVTWIAKPLGMDSLVCYSDGKKRGYFNMFTGKPVIEPRYSHAWIFSDGLASVEEDGWIKFIDASGKVVLDPKIPYISGAEGYVFHNNRCIVHNERRDRFGLIDKQGKWVLKPEYHSIIPSGKYLVVDNGEGQSVLDSALNTVIPFLDGRIWVSDRYISVTLRNHVMQRYNHKGEIVNDFYINDIINMTYESDDVRYTTKRHDDQIFADEKETIEPIPIEKPAGCRCYEAERGWYGLMAADGRVLTPPSYTTIKAVGYDLFLCKDNEEDGVLLNGRGERVR